MKLYQYHYLYKITNLINNKIYIGIHSTNKLDDDYFGSGTAICKAIKKYGKENFKKEILEWFDWRCEAAAREVEIVNEEFVKRNDTYNCSLGGIGGCVKRLFGKENGMFGRIHTEHSKDLISKNHTIMVGKDNPFYGKRHSDETKIKLRKYKTYKNNINPKAVKVIINKIEYCSITSAANTLKISKGIISRRIKSLDFNDYMYA